ncbi:MAG: dihydrofolate reductase [Propionibacteriaceae bacterium]|nr:dihydrofolate reductase [Propionibacteriaceae bacterium]
MGFAPTLRHSACESQNLVGQTRPGYCDFAQDDGGPPPNPTTPDQVQWASSVPAALDLAATLALPVFVAGGAQIYRAAWPYLTHLDITEVDLEPDGDALFPPIDSRWAESSREPHDGYAFVQYERAASERRPEENGSMCHSATSSCAQVAEQRTHSIGSDPATPLRSAPDDEDDPNDNRPLSQSLATTDDA